MQNVRIGPPFPARVTKHIRRVRIHGMTIIKEKSREQWSVIEKLAMHIVEIARLLLHFGARNTIVLRKLSWSTVLVSERGCCVEVNKDGAEASAKKTRRVSRIHSIASQGASISGSVRYYGTSLESAECSEQHTHTHTQLQVVGGWGRSKSKIELVVPPIFLPFSLLLLFHRAPPASGGISAGPRLGGSACQCRLHE